jgi:hypothetical protein
MRSRLTRGLAFVLGAAATLVGVAATPANANPIWTLGGVEVQAMLNTAAQQAGKPQNITCDEHWWKIRSVTDPSLVLDASRRDDTRNRIIHHTWNNGASQHWALCRTTTAPYEWQFVVRDSAKCVDLWSYANSDGAEFGEYTCNSGDNQRFYMLSVPGTSNFVLEAKPYGNSRFLFGEPYSDQIIRQYTDRATLYTINWA